MVGRAHLSVRFDEENADAHCVSCHAFLTDHPEEHRKWKKNRVGEMVYNNLILRSRIPAKYPDDFYSALKRHYEEELRERQQYGQFVVQKDQEADQAGTGEVIGGSADRDKEV